MLHDKKNFNIYWLFGLIIVVLILLSGILFIFSNYFNYVPLNYRFSLGFFIIAYGAFRLVNIIIKLKNRNDEDETD